MREFLYDYSMARNNERINHKLFSRTNDKPLWEYLVDSCKNLAVIPQLELYSWEYVTDQSKINIALNKKNTKDKKIKNNKLLDRTVPLAGTLTDLLKLTFKKTVGGSVEYVTREMLVFKQLKSGEYYINGKKALPIHQITENSTYVKDNVVKYKATLFGINMEKVNATVSFTDGSNVVAKTFVLGLFEKKINPLIYFLAQYGVEETISIFSLEDVVAVVPKPVDPDNYKYTAVSKNCYVEVDENAIDAHPFVMIFVASLRNALATEKNASYKDVHTTDYWLEILASQFSKKSVQKGKRVLISFSKIMDPTSRARLHVSKWHKRDTYSIIRWMMVNFDHILRKDNHDLANKRIRTTETLAYYFDAHITRNINSVLNAENITSGSIDRLLNSINLFTMMKAIYSNKNSPYSLFRYERYNDLDAVNLSRYTFKGPGGLNGGKNGTSSIYRDIYPSHYLRFDLNSSSDPGLTGYLAANVDIKEGGYFEHVKEPDFYEDEIEETLSPLRQFRKDYQKERLHIRDVEMSKNDKGQIVLSRVKSDKELLEEVKKNPYAHGLYLTHNGRFRLMPRYETNKAGRVVLKPRSLSNNGKVVYTLNKKSQIILEPRDGRVIGPSKKK